MPQKSSIFEESVNGAVIGDITFPYEFWTRDGKRRIDRGHFSSDEEAVAWFKDHYPEHFKTGIEMRVFE